MTNEEILNKAIEKAQKNGWKTIIEISVKLEWPNDFAQLIIFRHDFAKAFWGEKEIRYLPLNFVKEIRIEDFDYKEYELKLPAWEYHLKLLVSEENPLQYIGKYL